MPDWDSKMRHLPPKMRNYVFGNAKKHGLISQFSLFNRFFSLELKTPFLKKHVLPKITDCHRVAKQILTIISNCTLQHNYFKIMHGHSVYEGFLSSSSFVYFFYFFIFTEFTSNPICRNPLPTHYVASK